MPHFCVQRLEGWHARRSHCHPDSTGPMRFLFGSRDSTTHCPLAWHRSSRLQGSSDLTQEVRDGVTNLVNTAWPMAGASCPDRIDVMAWHSPRNPIRTFASRSAQGDRAWAVQVRERRECGMRKAAKPGAGSRQRSRHGGGGRRQVEVPTRYCSRCGQQMEVVRAVPGEPSWRAQFRCTNPECGK